MDSGRSPVHAMSGNDARRKRAAAMAKCEECSSGVEQCSKCDGAGRIRWKGECTLCKGTGSVCSGNSNHRW